MSPRAAWRLESFGFTKVFDYAPGKLDWVSAGLPVEGAMAGTPNLGTVARRDTPTCKPSEQISAVRTRLGPDPPRPCVLTPAHTLLLGLSRTHDFQAHSPTPLREV